MNDVTKRALKTALQGFVSTVVTLWGAAAVFSVQGAINISALERFGASVASAAIAASLSFVMSVVFNGNPPAPANEVGR